MPVRPPGRRGGRPPDVRAVRRLDRRGTHHRHRRPAERRQVDPVQRADQERRARRELPVRDDRAQRRRGRRARRPAGRARRDLRISAKIVPATVSFVDIAGIVRGASEGQGSATSSWPTSVRPTRSARSIRVFDDPDVVHVDGKIVPGDDIETINTELILADLQTVEKALPRLEKEARMQQGQARRCSPPSRRRGEVLDSRAARCPRRRRWTVEPLRELCLLTAKPFLYVFNVDDGRARRRGLRWTRCARWSPRPRRCSSTPRSSRS